MSEWIKRLAEKYSEVNEKKLTGNQHKLDMDKDGDIDGDDFKHMRNKKKANEEEEIVMNPKKDKKGKESENMAAEAKLDEISKDKVGRYIKKAMVSTSDAGMDTASQDKDIRKRGINTFVKRRMGASDAVRKLTGKARVPATESTTPTVYSRILEERAKHYKSATKPEDWDEKEKNNKGAMDMKKDMAVDTSDKISNYDDLGHDDASKAGRVTKAAKGRPGDNAAGDKNVINPVKK